MALHSHLRFPCSASGKGCPENTDGKFYPNKNECDQKGSTNGNSIADSVDISYYQLTKQASPKKQDTRHNKIR